MSKISHTTTDGPGPGILDIPDNEYHALRYCSKHALDVIADWSPMHLRYEREHPDEPTEAMKFGSAFHCLVLEPDEFDQRFVFAPKVDKRTNAGKAEWEKFCAGVPKGATILEEKHCDHLNYMRDAVMGHSAVRAILEADGENEQAVIWDEEISVPMDWTHRLRCKLKADIHRPSWSMLADLKTCACASLEAFEKSIAEFAYHRQGAMYQDGYAAHGVKIDHFAFICVEKAAPYGVAIYRLLGDAIELGRMQNDKLKLTYAACERNNNWWGYEQEFKDVSLPRWAFQRALSQLQK